MTDKRYPTRMHEVLGVERETIELPLSAKINSLVEWSDSDPFDIVQALRDNGVEVEE